MKKIIQTTAAILVLSLAWACSGVYVPGQKLAATDMDVAEKGPGSLNIEVVDYQWTYLNGGTHIRIVGAARNNSAQPYQSVTLTAVLHDEKGNPVAQGSTHLTPTYLPPGAEGSFEILALPSRTSGLKHTRLVTVCQTMR